MVMFLLLALGSTVTALWCGVLALVGRSTFPRRERLPIRSWRFADLRANVMRGAASCLAVESHVHPSGV